MWFRCNSEHCDAHPDGKGKPAVATKVRDGETASALPYSVLPDAPQAAMPFACTCSATTDAYTAYSPVLCEVVAFAGHGTWATMYFWRRTM